MLLSRCVRVSRSPSTLEISYGSATDVFGSLLVGSGHQSPGLWRHPDDQSSRFNEVSHWVELAKLLEEAKFHGIFIADVLGDIDVSHTAAELAD